MIELKNAEEIQLLKLSAELVSKTLAEVARIIKPGVSTNHLDKLAEEFIRDHHAKPGFLGYSGYPKTLCTSVNEQVVHGIPSDYILKDGDIVSVDCGVLLNAFYGDSAYTFAVGDVNSEVLMLLKRTKESLYLGIEQAIHGKRIGDIGYAIQSYCEANGYSVVREMVGHGIGKNLHEAPQVPNNGKRGSGQVLKSGCSICIEPMINMGTKQIVQENDGWTVRTKDKKPSAHFEHAVVVQEGQALVLSSFHYIEEVLGEKEF